MKEYKYKINGNAYKVTIGDIEDNIAHVEVNGTPYKVEMEKAPKVAVKPVVRPVSAAPAAPTVKKGQVIIILEAMKMENNINADKDGKITAINVSKGESVLEGTDLVIIE